MARTRTTQPGIIHVGSIIEGIACRGVFYNYMVCTLFFDRFFVGLFEGRVMKVQKYICRFN